MKTREIFFTKRDIHHGGVFLHFKENPKEKLGVVLVKMSEDYMFPLEGADAPLIECVQEDGNLRPPDQRSIDYHIDKIYRITSEQYEGEDVTVYIIKIKGEPNILGFLAHPDELEK